MSGDKCRDVHFIDRWKEDAFWKKLGEVIFLVANCKDYACAVLRKISKTVATRCHILKLK